ncbi:ATPase inhibitor B, mitochondrial isoform X1 [Ictalurus punctatus]|uniref:ATPase inhibitor, mitochondrial n=1 Tax=Ictalurus punctatus TaxID=7998 RepID=A0A2D0RP56_ICTPU|nr:ATPase inhibitor B, mitochondrial isoform X1 [Ictalurus punctatus]
MWRFFKPSLRNIFSTNIRMSSEQNPVRERKPREEENCGFVPLDMSPSLARIKNGDHQSPRVFAANISSQLGELGKGAGKGGGGGGAIREAGGAFGKRQAVEEEMYFKKKEQEQIAALRQHHQEEINHHQKEIERIQEEISRHEGKIRQLKKHD